VILKRKRARPVLQRHPWIFSGAIERIEGEVVDGDVVEVRDAGRNWLARGTLNRRSQIAVRLLTWERDEAIDREFWQRRLERAIAARQALALGEGLRPSPPVTTAYRLVHAESDYLPGLIVDRYGEWLVVQFLTLGIERWKDELVDLLVGSLGSSGVRGVYERSDVEVRAKEGLGKRAGLLWGEEPPELVEVLENGHRFLVDVRQGHKTGFYLDQRENRARLPDFCEGAEVLDAFAYTGAFGVYAAAAGAARVTLVESSARALDLARRNFALNGFERRSVEYVEGDVFSPSSPTAGGGWSERRGLTKTSTCWPSSCSGRAGCCSPALARAQSPPICSRRSSSARRWTRSEMYRSSATWRKGLITRWR